MSSGPSCSQQPFAGDESSHSVGDALGEKYRVREVARDATGRETYYCERVADGLEMAVNRLASFADDDGSATHGYKEDLLYKLMHITPNHEDVFEVRSGERTRVYVVQKAKTPRSLEEGRPSTELENDPCRREADENPTDIHGAPERRPGPVGARSTVLKRGDRELKVDIPPLGCCNGSSLFLMCSTICWLGLLLVCCGIVLIAIILTLYPFPLLMLPLTAVIWIAGLFLLMGAFRAAFLHESLSLTLTEFRIRRRVTSTRCARNAACDGQGTEASVKLLDRLFARQAAGRTANLFHAEVLKNTNLTGQQRERLVLWEGTTKHLIAFSLAGPEMEWLATEINQFIESTRSSFLDP